ncbi:colicin D domain-containing protein [Nocardia sp. NPDC058499]|uniref:colicin D domain-containing protein n=1 Tax=Nocardia sp. NPDC058499 TaxID=3346530 RepID=UPI00366327C4
MDGTYHGNPAILNYNPNSGLVVVQSPSGEFVSGWKLSEGQKQNVLDRGKLGGG